MTRDRSGRDAQLNDDGTFRDVDRIEFCRLVSGRFQWQLWSGDVLTHSEIGGPQQLQQMLGSTALFLLPPEEEIDDGQETEARSDAQTDQFSGRLDQGN